MAIRNVVILNDSTMLHCEVLAKDFELKTAYATIPLKKAQISQIEYRSKSFGGKDDVRTRDGTQLTGDLRPAIVPIEVAGTRIEVPKADIRYIVLFITTRSISARTRSKLKSLKP